MTQRQHNYLMKLWTLIVKLRDGYKCAVCGSIKNLNTHHIVDKRFYPLRYDPKNGITLCALHHKLDKLSIHNNPFFINQYFIYNSKNVPDKIDKKYLLDKTIDKYSTNTTSLDYWLELLKKAHDKIGKIEISIGVIPVVNICMQIDYLLIKLQKTIKPIKEKK